MIKVDYVNFDPITRRFPWNGGGTRFFLLWLVAVSLFASGAEAQPGSKSTRKALTKALKKSDGLSDKVGIHVVDLSSGETVFESNSGQTLNLASNGKLISTAAILAKRAGNFRFETRVHGVMNSTGKMEGNLYLSGGETRVCMPLTSNPLRKRFMRRGFGRCRGNRD